MNIWIITIGEPLINNKDGLRLHRTGILSKKISEDKSNSVIWWTSSFNHFTKKFELSGDESIIISNNLKLKCFKGTGYKTNISISRYIDHFLVQKKISTMFKREKKPDLIISSLPTIGLSYEAVLYGRENNIPVLVDYRDLWPEVYYDILPKIFKPLLKILFFPINLRLIKTLKLSTGIIGITPKFLDIALKKIGRSKTNFDSFFYLGYDRVEYQEKKLNKEILRWKKYLKISNDNSKIICFFGTIGHQFDFDTIIECFNKLIDKKIKLVICGTGDKLDSLKKQSKNSNVYFPGYISAIEIKSLMSISDYGICPYKPKQMFLDSIPGKAIEYMSEGLPIISTLGDGELGKLILKNKFGFSYNAFDIDSLFKLMLKILNYQNSQIIKRDEIKNYYDATFDKSVVYKNYANHIEKCIKNYNL